MQNKITIDNKIINYLKDNQINKQLNNENNFFISFIFLQAWGQQSNFTQYLLDIQYEAESLHQVMQGTFDNVRFIMSDELTVTNGNALNYTVRALDDIEEIRVEVNDFFAGLTGDSECISLNAANWELEVHASGDSISACANSADVQIETMTNNVYNILDAAQKTSTDMQNIVVNGFIGWNPFDSADPLQGLIDTKLNDIYVKWYGETVPALEVVLEVVVQSSSIIPSEVNVCLLSIIQGVQASSDLIKETASEC